MENEIITAVEIIKTAILNSQYEAAKDVNRIQLGLYFGIGRFLASKKGKKTWGTGVLETISDNLRKQLPGLRGFSATSLKKMRQFYENWSFLDVPNSTVTTDELTEPSESLDKSIIAITEFKVSVNFTEFPIDDFLKVPFSHHVQIFSRVKNLDERYFYITKTSQEHLAVEELNRAIDRNDFLHQKELPNNFVNTLSSAKQARKAVQMFKNEYLLDFINVEEIGERDAQDVDERVVENQIIQNIKNFIMTFGKDFTFVGNQYHLEAYGEEFFSDLLFFNRELNCLVVVELKTGEFKPSYLGQLCTYLRIIDDKVKKPHENSTIGIILCKSMNKEFVEYVIQDYDKPMGVSTYKSMEDMPEKIKNVMPDIEELRKLIQS
ncbi:MAG: YhcG family protein [Treponema sp.]